MNSPKHPQSILGFVVLMLHESVKHKDAASQIWPTSQTLTPMHMPSLLVIVLVVCVRPELHRQTSRFSEPFLKTSGWIFSVAVGLKVRAPEASTSCLPGKMPTVVSPELYRARFCEAMDKYFLMVPDHWTGLGVNC